MKNEMMKHFFLTVIYPIFILGGDVHMRRKPLQAYTRRQLEILFRYYYYYTSEWKLSREHAYYYQVQVQLNVCNATQLKVWRF